MILALMLLAFSLSDVSPQTWAMVALGSLAVSGIGTAIFKHFKMVRAEAITSAVFSGMRVFANDQASSKDPVGSLEDAVLAAAKDYGVHEHVDALLGPGLLLAPGGGASSTPTISPVPPPAGGSP